MQINIGDIWSRKNHPNYKVIVIQTPGRLVLYMNKDGQYGSCTNGEFTELYALIATRMDLLK